MGGRSEGTSDHVHGSDLGRRRRLLREALEEHRRRLLGDILVYVRKFGLASNHDLVKELGQDIFQDTAEIAFNKAEKYDDCRPPLPWLRVIAQNIVRNRLAEKKRGNRAFPVTDYVPRASAESRKRELDSPTEQEEFDALLGDDESENAVSRLTVEELLSLVGGGSRRVLRLALVEGLKGKALAAELGIREGSAHVALNRAKTQLREAYYEAYGQGPG